MCYDDEETTTTVTTTREEVKTVGPLTRQVEGNQFFVRDPVDYEKIYVNSTDDLYEDARGRYWNLV